MLEELLLLLGEKSFLPYTQHLQLLLLKGKLLALLRGKRSPSLLLLQLHLETRKLALCVLQLAREAAPLTANFYCPGGLVIIMPLPCLLL